MVYSPKRRHRKLNQHLKWVTRKENEKRSTIPKFIFKRISIEKRWDYQNQMLCQKNY